QQRERCLQRAGVIGADRPDQDVAAIGQAQLFVPRRESVAGAHGAKMASMALRNRSRREERVLGARCGSRVEPATCPSLTTRIASMAGSGDSNRAIFFALGANFAIACAKGVAAFFTGSSAMLAETVHSLADCGNQLLLLLGMRQSKRPPSPDYPLGYGKAIYFWSFLVAVMLFTVGGMFSLYEGIHKLQHPEPLRQWWWAAGVLVFGIVA